MEIDPSLASAINSRYNGTIAQHQGAIYDSGALQQSGSPVSQVYPGACKPETAYWHPSAEYNINPVIFVQDFFWHSTQSLCHFC